jgi:ribosomal protein S18 acetylase RimI-like enzyme
MQADHALSQRPAARADAEWARQTHHAAVRAVVERQFGGWNEAQQDRFFENDWTGGTFQIIEYEGQPCGYVSVDDRPDEVHVRELVIAPAFQYRGIGTAVMSAVIETARQRQVPVLLGTLHENVAANLYRRLGFVEVGKNDSHTLFRRDP